MYLKTNTIYAFSINVHYNYCSLIVLYSSAEWEKTGKVNFSILPSYPPFYFHDCCTNTLCAPPRTRKIP